MTICLFEKLTRMLTSYMMHTHTHVILPVIILLVLNMSELKVSLIAGHD